MRSSIADNACRPLLRLARDRSGATAVEFGLVAVPLLGLIFGVAEFGRAYWTSETLQQAAIATARCMGLRAAPCATSSAYDAAKTTAYAARAAARWSTALPSASIALNPSATCGGVANFSQVTLTTTFTTLAPALIPQLSSVPLSATACFPNAPS
jgi:Flp pilus assembly protein TadG